MSRWPVQDRGPHPGGRRAVLSAAALLATAVGWTSTASVSAVAAPTTPIAPQSRSLRDGIYSQEQAGRGQRLFERICSDCHAPDDFVGFLDAWEGDSVRSLFETVRLTMPEDNPARLKRDEYADVISYLFSLNGLPAGEAEMGSDATSLDDILIETANEEQGP